MVLINSLINGATANSVNVVQKINAGSSPVIQAGSSIIGNSVSINGVTYSASVPLVSKSSAYPITDQDAIILVTGTATVTLPTAVGCSGNDSA